MSRIFRTYLLGEITVIFVVMAVFSIIHNRLVAGMVAGSVFVALGAWIFLLGIRSKLLRRTFSFALGSVHLFAVALPMMITRLLNSTLAFSDVRILGLPGPVFHRLSTGIYLALLIGTLVDFLIARRKEMAPQK